MKKAILPVLIFLLAFLLAGCQKTLKGTDELIEKAREEIPLAHAEEMEIRYAGVSTKEDSALMWFVSGNEYQAHYYLPMECTLSGENEYIFERIHKPMERGMDIAVLHWKNGLALLVNNPECTAIQITDPAGTHIIPVEKDACPYILYLEPIPAEYLFLDSDGEELP